MLRLFQKAVKQANIFGFCEFNFKLSLAKLFPLNRLAHYIMLIVKGNVNALTVIALETGKNFNHQTLPCDEK
jgi:hypothetical protein